MINADRFIIMYEWREYIEYRSVKIFSVKKFSSNFRNWILSLLQSTDWFPDLFSKGTPLGRMFLFHNMNMHDSFLVPAVTKKKKMEKIAETCSLKLGCSQVWWLSKSTEHLSVLFLKRFSYLFKCGCCKSTMGRQQMDLALANARPPKLRSVQFPRKIIWLSLITNIFSCFYLVPVFTLFSHFPSERKKKL